MHCKISINDERLEKYLGRKMTEDEFVVFCKDAVIRKIFFEQQIKAK